MATPLLNPVSAASSSRRGSPTPKVAMRIERQAIERVAAQLNNSYDQMEDIYRRSRTSIVHLRHHAPEPGAAASIRTKVQELVLKTREFLLHAEKDSYGSVRWRAELAKTMKNLELTSQKTLLDKLIVPAEIEMFLKVVNTASQLYDEEGYDFSAFIDQETYVLAGMVFANFPAYHKTLNG